MKILRHAVCSAVFAAMSVASAAEGPAQEFALGEENATIRGKHWQRMVDGENYWCFSYGSAGFSVNFTGTEFWVKPTCVDFVLNDGKTIPVAVLVDGAHPMDATMYSLSNTWTCVASGLSDGPHSITIRKRDRGFGGFVQSNWIGFSRFGLDANGTVLEPDPLSKFVIEVYGDSISNGDAVWLNADGSNCAYTFGNWTGYLERVLDAEVRVCGNSGNGLCGWVLGSKNGTVENLYPPQNCWGVIDANANGAAYSHAGDNAADVVIINLGTNDRVEYNNGDLTAEHFGETYLNFIKRIKTDCPNAIVIATLGAMGGIGEFGEAISNAVNEANVWAGGTGRPFAFWVPIQGDGTIKGGLAYDNGHPSCLAGEVYGLKFAQLIKRELGLDVELPDDVSERVVRQMLGADLNVALFGTAFTSEGFSFGWNTKVENINDGKRNSGCQSSKRNTDPYDYIGVALAAPASVTNMVLYWETATYCGSYASDGYRLFYQAEKDGEWIRLTDAITVTRSGAVDTVALASPTTMHAVKVELRNGDANQFYPPKLFELEIYAETDGGAGTGSLFKALTGKTVAESAADVEGIVARTAADMASAGVDMGGTPVDTDLAKGSTASASDSDGNLPPAKAVDGSTANGSRWGRQNKVASPHWFSVDLGTIRTIDTVSVIWENRPDTMSIEVSLTGADGSWITVVPESVPNFSDFTTEGGLSRWKSVSTFTATCARYVRASMKAVSNNGTYYLSIYSFEVSFSGHGEGSIDCDLASLVVSDVKVPMDWMEDYGLVSDGDELYNVAERVAAKGANGVTCVDSYIAGLDPTDPDSTLQCYIDMVDGEPEISWCPDLRNDAVPRVYTVYGKAELSDASWNPVDLAQHRFFIVSVGLAN